MENWTGKMNKARGLCCKAVYQMAVVQTRIQDSFLRKITNPEIVDNHKVAAGRDRFASISLLILAAVACCLGTAYPQSPIADAGNASTPQASSPSVTPNARTVDTYFVALTKDGRSVTDLKAEEVRLFSDKTQLKIASVSPAAKEPSIIGFLFDMSGSRKYDKYLSIEIRAASEFVHSVWKDGDTGFVLAFNDTVYKVVNPTQRLEDIEQGFQNVSKMQFRGSTALYDALCAPNPEDIAAAPGRKVYVVFSDFQDNSSKKSEAQTLKIIARTGVSVFPVTLGESITEYPSKKADKRGREVARAFAEKTGGFAVIPDSQKELDKIALQLGTAMQGSYRVSFSLPGAASAGAGKHQKLRVESSRPQIKLLYPKD
jgi:VWFA-related protein